MVFSEVEKWGKAKILDTWSGFARFWRWARSKTLDGQTLLWQTVYMENYPELLRMQVESYKPKELDWKGARGKFFHHF